MLLVFSKKVLNFAIAVGIPSVSALTLPLRFPQISQAQDSQQQTVTINFAAEIGEKSFACGESYPNLGTTSTVITPNDFRFYITEVALIDENGQAIPLQLEQDGKWQYQNVALLDFEDKSGACSNGTVETRNKVVGTIPPGNYQGLQFTLGIPAELNHEDATLAASPLNLTSLWWNWRGGYKFMRLDLENQSTAIKNEVSNEQHQAHQVNSETHHHQTNPELSSHQSFPIHIGSTGCQANADNQKPSGCSNANQSIIKLDNFDPANNVVVADVANLLTQTDLTTNQPDTPMGCMSSPEDLDCLGIMEHLGLPFNGQASSKQTFFRVE